MFGSDAKAATVGFLWYFSIESQFPLNGPLKAVDTEMSEALALVSWFDGLANMATSPHSLEGHKL